MSADRRNIKGSENPRSLAYLRGHPSNAGFAPRIINFQPEGLMGKLACSFSAAGNVVGSDRDEAADQA